MPELEPHLSGIETVLVPTDLSANSLHALRYAAGLTKQFGAGLHVLHVSEMDFALPGMDSFVSDPEIAQSLQKQLQAANGKRSRPIIMGEPVAPLIRFAGLVRRSRRT